MKKTDRTPDSRMRSKISVASVRRRMRQSVVPLFVVALVGIQACGPVYYTSKYIDGTLPSVPLPFIGDTLPSVVVVPRVGFTNEGQIGGYVSKRAREPEEYLLWRSPQIVVGGTAEVAFMEAASLVGGGEIGGNSNRFFAGISSRERWWFFRWRGDLGLSYGWRNSRIEIRSSDGREEVREESGFKRGTYVASTIWFGETFSPIVQISLKNEEVLNSRAEFPLPSPDRGIAGITTAVAIRVGHFQWLVGYERNKIIGLIEPEPEGHLFFQFHFGW